MHSSQVQGLEMFKHILVLSGLFLAISCMPQYFYDNYGADQNAFNQFQNSLPLQIKQQFEQMYGSDFWLNYFNKTEETETWDR